MFKLITIALPLLHEIEAGVADPAKRRDIEHTLSTVLHSIARLTPPYTILGRACKAALDVLASAERLVGDPSTEG